MHFFPDVFKFVTTRNELCVLLSDLSESSIKICKFNSAGALEVFVAGRRVRQCSRNGFVDGCNLFKS